MFKQIATLIVMLTVPFTFAGCGSKDEPAEAKPAAAFSPKAPAKSTEPSGTPADGTWKFDQGEFHCEAVVANGKITIQFGSNGSSTLYWAGSFDAKVLQDGDKIVSVRDDKTMNNFASISEAKSVTFVYDNDELTYTFAMMGHSKPMHLTK